MSPLHVDRVTVEVGRARLVDAVSLRVEAGEVLALVGPNGAGKSTLLDALAGTRAPTSGAVRLDGRTLVATDAAALARRRAVVQQSEALEFPLSALEVVLLGRHPHLALSRLGLGREHEADVATAWRALNRVDAGHLAARAFPTLSGGEKQRVRIARALAQIDHGAPASNPTSRFLLCDEPAAGLDLAHARALHTLFATEARAGVGVVVVEHDLALAAGADRIAVLSGGLALDLGPQELA